MYSYICVGFLQSCIVLYNANFKTVNFIVYAIHISKKKKEKKIAGMFIYRNI